MTKMEEALKSLKHHQETGNYMSLYLALGLIIRANRDEPGSVDPLMRSLNYAVLEPLYIQVEKHLEDLRPKEVEEEKLGEVIFINFAKKKRAA